MGEPGRRAQREVALVHLLQLRAGRRDRRRGGGPFQEEELPKVPNMLTAREMTVLKYLAMGKTRDEVGIILGVSAETVKTHSKSIQVKLDAPNAAGAASRAYELGILRP